MLAQAKAARNANQHRVFGGVYVTVRRNCHGLQLQEELDEWGSAAADTGEPIHSGVQVELRLLAPVECGLRLFA